MTPHTSKKLSFEATRSINGEEYLISSNPVYLDHDAINAAFDTPDMFWAQSLDQADLAAMLDNSFCLGLYLSGTHSDDEHTSAPTPDHNQGEPVSKPGAQIGLARLITDHVTFAWLTDVYVLPEYRRRGLGQWMVEVLEGLFAGMPNLRRAMLIAEMDGMGRQYEGAMGCKVWENGRAVVMQRLGPAGGSLGTEGG